MRIDPVGPLPPARADGDVVTGDTAPGHDPMEPAPASKRARSARYAGIPERLRPGLKAPSSSFFPTVDSCPGCHGELRCTTVHDTVVFACAGCHVLWRFELGYVYRVRMPRESARGATSDE